MWVDQNSVKYWFLLVGMYLFLNIFVSSFHSFGVFIRLALVVVALIPISILLDIISVFSEAVYFDPEVVIQRGYSVSLALNDTPHSQGIDYGFNFYNGDLNKSRQQAQIDKFEFAIDQLGIQDGDRVIDIGCGCGDWLYYLKHTKGCDVHGVNITEAQAKVCAERGLKIARTNWKDIDSNEELKKELYGKFDAVTFWDTVEHYVPQRYLANRAKQDKIYQDMFTLAKNLIDENSPRKKIYISCLHMRHRAFNKSEILSKPWKYFSAEKLQKIWYTYILDRFHSGFYPSAYFDADVGRKRDQLVENAEEVGVECVWRKDVTYDYYITSVLEPTHFGRHKFEWNLWRVMYVSSWFICDPYWWARIVWFTMENWMFQFDSKDINNSDVILWWLLFDVKK